MLRLCRKCSSRFHPKHRHFFQAAPEGFFFGGVFADVFGDFHRARMRLSSVVGHHESAVGPSVNSPHVARPQGFQRMKRLAPANAALTRAGVGLNLDHPPPVEQRILDDLRGALQPVAFGQ